MQKIDFTKMVASGNDFVVIPKLHKSSRNIRDRLPGLARKSCDWKFAVGADGLLILEKSKAGNIRMRIFNADGSEPQMCGNGARCVALYIGSALQAPRPRLKIRTKAGIIESEVKDDNVKIKLTAPKGLKLDIPIKINRTLHVNFINTGVPHTVIFVEGLERIDVVTLGRQIRYHKKFAPAGTNVDFVEVLNNQSIRIRSYERGVEDETLGCGTGAVASALIVSCRLSVVRKNPKKINVHTESGEVLKVYFDKIKDKFENVWLEGKAKIAYKGVYYV